MNFDGEVIGILILRHRATTMPYSESNPNRLNITVYDMKYLRNSIILIGLVVYVVLNVLLLVVPGFVSLPGHMYLYSD